MIRTAEYVSKGHPDKVADQISDALLDAYLKVDPDAHVAIETLCTTNTVVLSGEVLSTKSFWKEEIEEIVRKVIADIGYEGCFGKGFNSDEIKIYNHIHTQSTDLQANQSKGIVAGDQGIMVGYACNETPTYMPIEHYLARFVIYSLDLLRIIHPEMIGPDSKSQVTVQTATWSDKPWIERILISTQHSEDCDLRELRTKLDIYVWNMIKEYCSDIVREDMTPIILINPAGRFVEGGPSADTGLTGRKIVVDSYGGRCPVGGGAFSGKDPSKVDRSAAYFARYVAKNVVASGICSECEIRMDYTIGNPRANHIIFDFKETLIPGLRYVDVCEKLERIFSNTSVSYIVDKFGLKEPIYQTTATYGHFGIPDYPWEKLDKVDRIKEVFNVK